MIHFKLKEVLKQLNCSRNKFSTISGVRPNTINDMCNGQTRRLEIDTLNAILQSLNDLSNNEIKIDDIIEFRRISSEQPDKSQQ